MNKLFLVSGHSGSGKSTVMKALMFNEVVSFTTRLPRQGEQHGKDYKFITLDDFRYMENNGLLIEKVSYGGNFYGIDSEELESKLSVGDAFCIVDFHGMKQLKEIYPNCVSIFLYTPYEQAREQMKQRGDSKEQIEKRLSVYDTEIMNKIEYDYVIKNKKNKLENTMRIIKEIIDVEAIQ